MKSHKAIRWIYSLTALTFFLAISVGCGEDDNGPVTINMTGQISGIVTDGYGDAAAGTVLTVASHTHTVDASGTFFLDKIPAGNHTLTASHPDYEDFQKHLVVHAEQVTQVTVSFARCQSHQRLVDLDGEEICLDECDYESDCGDNHYCHGTHGICIPEG